MDKTNNLKLLEQKYKFVLDCDLIPYENIPDTIKEVSDELFKIDSMISENIDLNTACEKLKSSLIGILDYLKEKLERFLDIKVNFKHLY